MRSKRPELGLDVTAGRDVKRTGLRGSLVVGITMLLIGAIVFTNAGNSVALVDTGIVLSRTESSLAADRVALKALSQAVLLVEDEALGVSDRATSTKAIEEARAAADELEGAVDALTEAGGPRPATADDALALARQVTDLLETGSIDAAGDLLATDALDAFEGLQQDLDEARQELELALTEAGSAAARLSSVATFFIAFLLPAGLVFAYRRNATRQLKLAEVQLGARLAAEQEVSKAKDEFIGSISHELRTPLTAIYGFSEVLLESGMVDPASSLDLVGVINDNSAELTRMVEDLLVAARSDSGTIAFAYQPVDMSQEIENVVATAVRTGGPMAVDLAQGLVRADPMRVRQIMRNLLSNAQRYGGPRIRITGSSSEHAYAVTVADDGPGVSADMEDRLFTRFVHRADDALIEGSVGLGLSVVADLVGAMGGEISYEHLGGWTRFSFWLPAWTETKDATNAGHDLTEDMAANVARPAEA